MFVVDLAEGTVSRVGRGGWIGDELVGDELRDPLAAYRLAALLNGYEEPVTAQEAATVVALRRLAA